MQKLSVITVLGVLFLAGCAAPKATKMNQLSVGMTKADVVKILGTPSSISAKDNEEYLVYRLSTAAFAMFPDSDRSDTDDYFVQVVDGKVTAYGEKGEFGTIQSRQRKQHEIILP